MQSLTIALALCNVSGTLDPIAPYRALAVLGGEQGGPSEPLSRWLQNGAVSKGSPTPVSTRAGSADGDLAGRQQALRAYLTAEHARFREQVVEQDDKVSVYDYPVSWELREQIVTALESLVSAIMATRTDDSGV